MVGATTMDAVSILSPASAWAAVFQAGLQFTFDTVGNIIVPNITATAKLAELTDNVLFGDVWERPGLSKRDRSLITVAALIAMNRPEQLRSHLQRARENGVTKEELSEVMTHLAFYAGWPNAITAAGVARDVFEKKWKPRIVRPASD